MINDIRILYQPIVSLADGRTRAIEVLVRHIGPQGEMMGPEKIVCAMTGPEESLALTEMIMRRSLAEIVAAGFDPQGPVFGFNMPLDAMQHPNLLPIIEGLRQNAGLPTRLINFELTERHEVQDVPALLEIISQLRQAGYGLALDDVTPAMLNLPALLDLPIQAVKLDHSIVNSLARDDEDFIRRVVAHAASRQQHVVAEGIETAETWRHMQALGVGCGQGFLFAEPLRAADLKSFLAAEIRDTALERIPARG